MNKLIFISSFLVSSLYSNIGPSGFGPYINRYFVETGTFGGDGAQKALNAGFSEIRTIEYEMNNYNYSRERFKNRPEVKIWQGSSATGLWDMISDIKEPITFWLDAHIYPPLEGVKNCPLIEELEQIKRHPIKTHTILIDDMSCAGTGAFDSLTKDDLIQKILEINPDYHVYYIDGGDQGEAKDNIMVAVVNRN